MTSRIAGALAHELNNPLQAALSIVTTMSREAEATSANQQRLELLRTGIQRASSIVEILSVLYENIPREPDTIKAVDLVARIRESLHELKVGCTVHSEVSSETAVLCMVPELARLLTMAVTMCGIGRDPVRITMHRDGPQTVLTLATETPSPTADSYLPLLDSTPVSGLSVMIDEIARLGQGYAEFSFDDNYLRGIRITLRTRMT